jgi:cytochrome c-type biogenesis protein CcmH
VRASLVAALLALAPVAALAEAQTESALDRRVHDLALELRCLVCQNQSLADSQADLAVDLRNQIREQLARGESEQQVVDYLVARYGEFVLYRPRLEAKTIALWAGPFVLLALGALVLWRRVSRRAPPVELSDAERARAEQLLE